MTGARGGASRAVADIFGVLLSGVVVVPIYFVVVNSFKSAAESAEMNLSLPTVFRAIENYRNVFVQGYVLTAYKNSVLITVVSCSFILLFSSMAAFVVQRRGGRTGKVAWQFILAGLIMPPSMVTTTLLCKALGLGSVVGVICIFVATHFPLAVFIYRAFFNTVPREMDEAAVMDGSGTLRTFFAIILPLIQPATMTVLILSFMEVWNNFNIALYFLTSARNYTMPITIYFFFGQYASTWNLVFADVILILLPVVIVFILAQRYIISGMVSGAVKG
jgi:raffinose/stachyose/melibiose transport system permease protein